MKRTSRRLAFHCHQPGQRSARRSRRALAKRLSGFLRFCSAKALGPDEVSEEVLDEYMRYRAETTALATDEAARRKIARAWNAC